MTKILLLHGAGMDHRSWDKVAVRFSDYEVLVPDLPPLSSIAALAEWTEGYLAQSRGPFLVAGHSMGSLIALRLAARRNLDMAGLVLVATAYPMAVHSDFLALAAAADPKAVHLMNKWSYVLKPPSGDLHLAMARVLENMQAEKARGQVPSLAQGLMACNAYDTGLEDARQARCPVRFILGSLDKMTPVDQAMALVKTVTHANLNVVSGAGHALLDEEPEWVAAGIRALLPEQE